jgi:hypothetical protein
MICCKCNEDKPDDKCIVKRNICVKCDRRERYIKNRDRDLTQQKKLYAEKYKNDPKFIERRKEYDRIRKETGERSRYSRERYKNDIVKIQDRLRQKISRCIRICKDLKNVEIIGCTIKEFKEHIESLFKEGMTWENYGPKGWHIDHIKPYKLFNLLDPEEQKKCCHYTNLQPLWWHENIAKSDNYNN